MRILITGGLGHIGSSLIRKLPSLIDNCEIVITDNMIAQRYCSLFNLDSDIHYEFYEEDILNSDLDHRIKGADVVIHLAAITNASSSFENATEVESVNFIGTKNIAEACLNNDVKLIFLSTTSVYGTQKDFVDESCTIDELLPQSPYAKSKLDSELHLMKMSKDGLKYVICRFGTIYGISEGMRFHTAVNKFCWQSVLGEPLSVWRTALHQKRPYLDLSDGVRALAYIMKNNIFDGEVYNILSANHTVNDIIGHIEGKLGKKVDIDFVDSEIMNQLSYNVLNQKFKDKGFKFEGNLAMSIQETLDIFKCLR